MMKKMKLLVLLALLFSTTLLAQPFEPIGPWGGRVNVFTRTSNGNIYAATIGAGFFKSTDNGNTWREVNVLGTVRTSFAIESIADTVWGAPFGVGIFKTTDGGNTWIADSLGGLGNRSIYAIYADANGNLYTGGLNTGVFFKPPGATVWQNITGDLPVGTGGNPRTVRSIFKDSNGLLYIGTEGGTAPNDAGIYTSTNNGINWVRNSTGLGTTSPSVRAFVQRGDTLFVGVFSGGAGVYRKALTETAWTIDTLGLGQRGINALHIDASGNLYAGLNPTNPGGVFRRAAGSSSWSQVALAGQSVWGFIGVGTEIFIGSNLWAVSRTTNFSSLTISNTGINALSVLALKVGSDGNLYAGINSNGGVQRSTDNGATWQMDTVGLGARTIWALEEVNGTLFAAAGSNGVFRRTLSGWVAANTGIATRTVDCLLAKGDTLIAGLTTSGTNPVIYRTTNSGANWFAGSVSALPSLGAVRALGKDNLGNLYAGMSSSTTVLRGLLKSTNGGVSWFQSNGVMNPLNEEFYAIAFNPVTNTLYAAPNVSGIFKSTDAGVTWVSDSTGMSATVDDILIPTTLPPSSGLQGSMLAACLGQNTEGGVFVQRNTETSWSRVGLDLFSVNALAEKSGVLYAATNHSSIYKVNYVNIGLPVELIEFGYRKANKGIELFWKTASEQNNEGFQIERRRENDAWQTIGFVRGKGTTTEVQSYSFVDERASGKLFYRLKQRDFNGAFEYSTVIEVNLTAPEKFELAQNYPNPFNPTTTLTYKLPISSDVRLEVFDVLGRKVATLVNATQEAGNYTVNFNGSTYNLTSGVYFYRLQASATNGASGSTFVETKKMMLVK
ncbi:MAG: two-component regulator propeller domain-containing protein [Chloroherpetonaceae bacterium]